MASRSQPVLPPKSGTRKTAPSVQCDLCDAPFTLPDELRQQGAIYGLLVCSQCVEDNLHASADEPRAEVGLA